MAGQGGRMQDWRDKLGRWLLIVTVHLAVLVLWQLWIVLGEIEPYIMPTPLDPFGQERTLSGLSVSNGGRSGFVTRNLSASRPEVLVEPRNSEHRPPVV